MTPKLEFQIILACFLVCILIAVAFAFFGEQGPGQQLIHPARIQIWVMP